MGATYNASSDIDVIPRAWKMHVDGASTRIGPLDYPLVRVFGHEFARDGIDACVRRRHCDAGARRTGAGRPDRFGSRSRRYARSGDRDRFGTTELLVVVCIRSGRRAPPSSPESMPTPMLALPTA